jgi:hypothetical protein
MRRFLYLTLTDFVKSPSKKASAYSLAFFIIKFLIITNMLYWY